MTPDFSYEYCKHLRNPAHDVNAHSEFSEVLLQADCRHAQQEISSWEGYAATPLIELPDFATAAGVGSVVYKDESPRFGLGSFKALGGSYAVAQLADEYRKQHGSLAGFAVATATDGNHGKSVAWGAQRLGVECHIFIHAQVSQQRSDAITELGAHVHRVAGNYDDSLVECETMARAHGWQIVSDTSWEGYETVPVQIMAGYSVMAAEIVAQLKGKIPTHFFIPAGCGGLAGGMLAYFWQVWKEQLPAIVIVESEYSACVYKSIEADDAIQLNVVEETVMAGLSCGEVSQIIWPLLRRGVKHAITIPDEGVVPTMRSLAKPAGDDRPAIEAGECSAAGLIALLAAAGNTELQQALDLNQASRVLVLGTEGATDPEFYHRAIYGTKQKFEGKP